MPKYLLDELLLIVLEYAILRESPILMSSFVPDLAPFHRRPVTIVGRSDLSVPAVSRRWRAPALPIFWVRNSFFFDMDDIVDSGRFGGRQVSLRTCARSLHAAALLIDRRGVGQSTSLHRSPGRRSAAAYPLDRDGCAARGMRTPGEPMVAARTASGSAM